MLRALTMTQPWCGLIVAGIKLIENRPHPMIKREDFGVPFALHASGEIDEDVYERIHEIAPELYDYAADGTMAEWYRLSRITSAVIGLATVVDVIDVRQYVRGARQLALPTPRFNLDRLQADQRRWFFGPVGYVLRDGMALANPVACPGKQPFWHVPTDIERQIREQI